MKTDIHFYHISINYYCNEKCFRQSCRENKRIHFIISFFKQNRAVYEVMWKNIVQLVTSQMTIWRMRTARWIEIVPNLVAHGDAREGK